MEPDSRNRGWSGFTESSLENDLSQLNLPDNIPIEVTKHFNIAKKLCQFGWYEYDFYAISIFWSLITIETALRVKLQANCNESFQSLFREAVREGLIKSDTNIVIREIPDIRTLILTGKIDPLLKGLKINLPTDHTITIEQYLTSILGDISKKKITITNAMILANTIPNLRNEFAHPDFQWILPPGSAFSALEQVKDIIIQLFMPKISE